MKQQFSLLPEHVSSEDWENTPPSIKCLVNSLIEKIALLGTDRKRKDVERYQVESSLQKSEL